MRIVFCRSNPVDPDPRVEKEARALKDAGHQVKVAAWDRTGELPKEEIWDQIPIHRLAIRADYARGMGNLPALIRWLAGLTGWLLKHRKSYDLIHACDFDTIFPALLFKFLLGKKVVYDIFDFYADHLRATPVWIKRLIRSLDLWAVRRVDGVILVDRVREEQLGGVQPERLIIINNTPRDLYDEVDRQDRTRRSSLSIVYVGLLQVERGLLKLLQVLEDHPSWHLDLAGFGGDQERILKKAQRLANVTWHGRISYQKALELTAACDVSLATYDPSIPNHRYASPNKIFEAMMLAKPVIAARDTHMDQIISTWKCGLVVPYGDRRALTEALRTLEADPALREELGRNGRRAYQEQYAWSTMQERLLAFYEAIGKS